MYNTNLKKLTVWIADPVHIEGKVREQGDKVVLTDSNSIAQVGQSMNPRKYYKVVAESRDSEVADATHYSDGNHWCAEQNAETKAFAELCEDADKPAAKAKK